MIDNPVIQAMLNRKSIRRYTTEEPSEEVIATIVRAGQQAPFAGQFGSLLLSREREGNPFRAPLLFTMCVDSHRMEEIMQRRNWPLVMNDLSLLLFGIQDASLMAENMVIAAESLGLGSCFLGGAPYRAEQIIAEYELPPRVFPLVQLAMGYPAEDPPPRPRYPMDLHLFEDKYPVFDDERVERAMAQMDGGYLAQDYYRRADYMVPLEDGREETETFDTYGWTEHMGRKWGQWAASPQAVLEQLAACGFRIPGSAGEEEAAPKG